MSYNFDEIIPRANTNSVKYDLREKLFGRDDVLPMWVADMDFRVPPPVSEAISKRTRHEIYGYSIRPESFYQAVMRWTERRYHWPIAREWLTFTPGIVPGVNLSIMTLTEPGDKVMIQPPVYFPFFQAVKKNGRQLVENRLFLHEGRYHIDMEDFEKQLKSGVKLFILSNPHNPGGSVWTRGELKTMGELCCRYGALIIADEIHSDIVFPGHVYTPMASISEEIKQNTVTFLAPSKTFNIAGLTTSVGIIPNRKFRGLFNEMIERIHLAHGNIFGNVALEAAYNYGEQWLEELISYLTGNVQLINEFIEDHIPGIQLIKPEGTYLAWLDCRELPVENDRLNRFMVERAGVGMNEGSAFGENGTGFQRLNFGCPRKTLRTALENIEQAVGEIL
ncbi:MAG: PatB family C-S lyase [Bacteroidales bacterium]|nr:PatB family C-S lyase [Bacteroidales bacterium]